ncbi:hypothetical protein SAMN05661093_09622 [Kibdelosporangium aridum]|uniref:Uncharacterized protein n=1 Tax=Kibdelosporangium aridum TaxID=2030 RepID=A0A1W2FW84_KIBAR|nr:hypothetical protein SAMN05661093_09622 [Kibdelosporangium aridum]
MTRPHNETCVTGVVPGLLSRTFPLWQQTTSNRGVMSTEDLLPQSDTEDLARNGCSAH